MTHSTLIAEENTQIAIIGMALRFPEASNIQTFWENLKNNKESISFFSKETLMLQGVDPALLNHPNYVRAKGIIDQVEWFDAPFFNFNAREASILDVQHRVFLECVHELLETAGYDPDRYSGLIGIYAGTGMSTYFLNYLLGSQQKQSASADVFQMTMTNDKDFLATLAAYKCNLKGPCVNIQTACSTSLVAVHIAVQSLLAGECDMAIAGGVSIDMPQIQGYLYEEGMIMSPDGHCRAFDALAKGTVGGNGCGVVLLKRLSEALHDHDTIYAVIRGSAVNNDGSYKVGFTAPSIEGQVQVITEAISVSGVDPETITYIETHGTGTPLGDPIEIAALTEAFRQFTKKKKFCAIGSVKTNIGHLNTASGIAGLIKTVLAIYHGCIPATLHFSQPNPKIDFSQSPFWVNTQFQQWQPDIGIRRAGVSSFGIGGTNAHVILEQAPAEQPIQQCYSSDPVYLFPLSAKTEKALEKTKEQLACHINAHSKQNLGDVAYTLQVGRKAYPYRSVISAGTHDELANGLLLPTTHLRITQTIDRESPCHVVFMFPGQGAQYMHMGYELYQRYPEIRTIMDTCIDYLLKHHRYDLKPYLFPGADESLSDINQTANAQVAIFVISYAMANLCIKFGIYPNAMIGHSIGEYVAACISGVFSLENALSIVYYRGQFMQQMPPGAMLAVAKGYDELISSIDITSYNISVAAINSPSQCVISGPIDAISLCCEQLKRKQISYHKLKTSHAFHSSLMAPAVEMFFKKVSLYRLHEFNIPFISNMTGNWITANDVVDPGYWAKHIRETVQFASGIDHFSAYSSCIFLEIGPGQILSHLARQQLKIKHHKYTFASTLTPTLKASDTPEQIAFLHTLAQAWVHGIPLNWTHLYHDHHVVRRLPLPTYPLERQPYILKPNVSAPNVPAPTKFQKNQDISTWFYVSSFERFTPRHLNPPTLPSSSESRNFERNDTYMIIQDALGIGKTIGTCLEQAGHQVVLSDADSIEQIQECLKKQKSPNKIIYFGNCASQTNPEFFEFLFFVQALCQSGNRNPIELIVITQYAFEITGTESSVNPEQTMLFSPVIVIPQEYPWIQCRCIDIEIPKNASCTEACVRHLVNEITYESWEKKDRIIGLRGNYFWRQRYVPIRFDSMSTVSFFKNNGVYLILGGFGKIGSTLAIYLFKIYNAKLVLVGRSIGSIPQEIDVTHILTIQADISDIDAMQECIKRAKQHFGQLSGIIHAAGITGKRAYQTIDQTTEAYCENLFLSKIQGLLVLSEITCGLQLDGCIIISSISSILGGIGLCGYAGANLFMDAFCHTQNLKSDFPWITINWEGFQFDSYKNQVSDVGAFSITPEEAMSAFDRIVRSGFSEKHIIVSSGNLDQRIEKWVLPSFKEYTKHQVDKQVVSTASNEPQTGLNQPCLSAENQETCQITIIFQELLGTSNINENDHFFDLGGHSLLATQLLSRLRTLFHLDIPLYTLFENLTIAKLSRLIIDQKKSQQPYIQKELVHYVEQGQTYGPLSFAQERLWFLYQFDPENLFNNLSALLRIEGKLDIHALHKSFMILSQKHSILRTTFLLKEDGTAFQQIYPEMAVDIPIVMLTKDMELDSKINEIMTRPFDLHTGPLLRINLFKLEPEKHVLLLVMHHMITDGWSMRILIQEMSDTYQSIVHGNSLDQSILPAQYLDFAIWQKELLNDNFMQLLSEYWENELKEAPLILDLPLDHPRDIVPSFDAETFLFSIPEELNSQLIRIATHYNATPFMVFLSVFGLLLSRYCRTSDLLIGTPVANRNQKEIESIVGFFVNTLVIRLKIDESNSFSEYQEEKKKTVIRAFDHQDMPFERLLDLLRPDRHVSITPIVQVMFVMQHAFESTIQLDNITLTHLIPKTTAVQFDLTLEMTPVHNEMTCALKYKKALFDSDTIAHMADHYVYLLEQIVTNSNLKLSQYRLLLPKEYEQIQLYLTGEKKTFPVHLSLPDLFEQQVQKTPNRMALIFRENYIQYHELNEYANQVAYVLLESYDIHPENRIGVCMHRSHWPIIALLGILKANAVYVPIDAGLPLERIKYMVENSGCHLVLYDATTKEIIQGLHLDCLSIAIESLRRNEKVNPVHHPNPEELAYIIYTSGSTGKPKGVMIEHQGFINMIYAQKKAFDIQPHDRVIQFSSMSFDASLSEIFMTLLSGACLFPIPKESVFQLELFIDFMNQYQISVATLPPTYVHMIPPFQLLSLKTLIIAGESPNYTDTLEYAKHLTCFNAYGPTEASVCSTYFKVDPTQAYPRGIPIGQPIPNTQIHILDQYLNPVPMGVLGEICISGMGLARGYCGSQELTDRAFIFHPVLNNTRLYRTGDLGMVQHDGTLVFKGRIDHQVKIHGHRIELEEIEQVLRMHPDIDNTCVIAARISDESHQLRAFYIRQKKLELWPSVAEFFIYDEVLYQAMASHQERNLAYEQVFRKKLKDKIIVEIGPGPEAILSLLSIQAGAKKVYAIERLKDSYIKAQEKVKLLGLDDRILLIHGDAMNVQLPEKVDYCISEIVGPIGGMEGSSVIINRARRFLRKPTHMIPEKSITYIAGITLPEDFSWTFSEIAVHYIEKIFSEKGSPYDLRLCLKHFSKSLIISTQDVFEYLDYTQPLPLDNQSTIRIVFTGDSLFHGFIVWLKLFIDHNHYIDILDSPYSWLPVYLPVSVEGIRVQKGDRIEASIIRTVSMNHVNPDYRIEGRLFFQNGNRFDIDVDSLHTHSYYRDTPFYKKLFETEQIRTHPPLNHDILVTFLKERLPEYMIPALFKELERFPLTQTGKVDRKALKQDGIEEIAQYVPYVAPRDEKETHLCNVWQTVLKTELISIYDHFFVKGGDSLKAIKMAAQLRELRLGLDIRHIFQYPILYEMAAYLTEISVQPNKIGPIKGKTLPLTAVQQWFFEHVTIDQHQFNQCILLKGKPRFELNEIRNALESIWDHHDILHLQFHPHEKKIIQIYARGDISFAFDVIDLRSSDDESTELKTHIYRIQTDFNLQTGPLMKSVLFHLKASDRLFVIFHHLVIDGVSSRFLLEELNSAYKQALNKKNPIVLPRETCTFQEWTENIEMYSRSKSLKAENIYWQNLARIPIMRLPNAHIESENLNKNAKVAAIQFTQKQTQQLIYGKQPKGISVQAVLISALAKALSLLINQDQIAMLLVGHGREPLFKHLDITRCIGWFSSFYPVVLTLPRHSDPTPVILGVQQTLNTIPRKGVGYSILRYVSHDPILMNSALPEVAFNYIGPFDEELEAEWFEIAPEPLGHRFSPRQKRPVAMDVSAIVLSEMLSLSVIYDSIRFHEAMIQRLLQDCKDFLLHI